jgi:hypothetical protein
MCLEIFIASEQPLSLIPFDETKASFNISELGEYDRAVRKHFTKPFVYYLATQGGCGCSLNMDIYETAHLPQGSLADQHQADVLQELELGRQILTALTEYIDAILVGPSLELYSCWSGDWHNEPLSRIEIKFEQTKPDQLWQTEGQLMIIER